MGGFVYILADFRRGQTYIGVTSDLVRRIHEHRQGLVEGYTRRKNTKRLVYFEEHDDIAAANAGASSAHPKWRKRQAGHGGTGNNGGAGASANGNHGGSSGNVGGASNQGEAVVPAAAGAATPATMVVEVATPVTPAERAPATVLVKPGTPTEVGMPVKAIPEGPSDICRGSRLA